jgi:3-dehydroquinate dehydratase I
MKIPYCLPILKERKTEVLRTIRENIHRYPYFEVWLDYVNGVDEAFVDGLTESLKGRLVVILRRKNLERTRLSLEQKTDLILLLENSQSLLDLDIGTQQEELGFVQAHSLKIKVITSYHDYRETPDDKTLEQVIDTMKRYKPEIFKIATLCQCRQDALRLLQLLLKLKSEDLKCIVLGMGSYGAVTRVFGTLWGNELIFAPEISAERSAEGQLTRNQLQTVFRELMR